MRNVQIGILGCGYWGPNFVRNFNQINGCSVKYACDLSRERLLHMKNLYPQIMVTRDYKKVLRDNEITAVIVATSATKHFIIAKEALLSGKHVLVEKPITTDLGEAQELIDIAKRKNLKLMVGHTFKFNPGVRKLKALLDASSLGKVFYIYSRRTNLGPLRKDVNAMWDLAPHDISIMNYLLGGNPLAAQAQGERYLAHNLEDVSFITLFYPSKVLAHIHVGWLDPKKNREIVIVGSKRMAIFDDLDAKNPVTVYDKRVMKKIFKQEYESFREFQMIIKNGKAVVPKVKQAEPLKLECEHFIDCIRRNKKPFTDGRDGLEVLRVLKAIDKSLNQGNTKVKI